MKTFRSFSSEETKTFGAEIAKSFIARHRTQSAGALVIALRGDLGAGKTTFTQGFFRGLGIKRNPISPTFVIMRRYRIPANRFREVYHFDAYRLKKEEDVEALEFGKIMSDPKNIILVEWPEKIQGIFPRGTVRLDFLHGKKENERVIKIKLGPRLSPR
jgi:tRNA threonylcarbamoyladenosine biosynthesis protein TsaE